ncbi:MAG: Fe-S cluster assembly protein SufD [Planctomycetes bacterium]|nr:Fe-S cluster assembly protein SufD [Planctomycetota bacterium]
MTKESCLSEYDRLEPALPGLRDLRRRAIARFGELGFPTGREEEWRFTDVSPVAERDFPHPDEEPDASEVEELASGPLAKSQLAFVDGLYAPEFSSPPHGVTAESLGDLLDRNPAAVEPFLGRTDGGAFAALNTALFRDGAFVRVPRGTAVAEPLHLIFLSTTRAKPFAAHPRILAVVEEGASIRIAECHAGGTSPHLTNAVVELEVGEGAHVDWSKIQREGPEAYHFATVQVRQARGSVFASHSISLGAALSRNDLGVLLDGEGAECSLDGLYELGGTQLADNHTTIDHAKPHGTSRELYKGILDGRSRGVFDGRIVVRPGAQKTDAIQTNRNLLLSAGALANTKPQLEIFANDVKCKHGATIGKLDPDVLFYLRSRGIGREEAQRLLIHAFACEVLDAVPVAEVRERLEEYLLDLVSRKAGV